MKWIFILCLVIVLIGMCCVLPYAVYQQEKYDTQMQEKVSQYIKGCELGNVHHLHGLGKNKDYEMWACDFNAQVQAVKIYCNPECAKPYIIMFYDDWRIINREITKNEWVVLEKEK